VTRHHLALLAVTLLVGLPGATDAATRSDELQAAWQSYARKDADRRPKATFPYQHCFRAAADRYDLPLTLLIAVARGESDFDPTARSSANAHGVMQILWPGTARHLGFSRLSELYVPCRNIDAGARYLRELVGRYDGDLHLALAAYNYGPKRISATSPLPYGAVWYSGYIYRHLGYVMGEGGRRSKEPATEYTGEGKLVVIEFGAPYRAEAFVATVGGAVEGVRLDWFRVDVGRFQVVMLYRNARELEEGRVRLAAIGYAP
jgi:hypothetical protein